MGNDPTLRRKGGLPRRCVEARGFGARPICLSAAVKARSLALTAVALLTGVIGILAIGPGAAASTYVVYVALDDPVYQELDTLNGLGLLDDYISEVRPIARVEAARLTLEAEQNLDESEQSAPIARSLIKSLREEFSEEVQWLIDKHEDSPPTTIHPLERIEAQYIYSGGTRRLFALGLNPLEYQAREGTPLLPDNDGLPTSDGSNEILRISNWAGLGGFVTAYGETSVAGPITRSPSVFEQAWGGGTLARDTSAITETSSTNRLRLLRGGVVGSLGNQALSFGYQEMAWGTGFFGALSQGINSRPFPALMFQNVHASPLPWLLRYLGPFRHQIFVGRLDHGRYSEFLSTRPPLLANYAYPWISGQIFAFKPLPTFEFGLNHVIMFGGTSNSDYGWKGWLGRATGLNTGYASEGNTNSRAGAYVKLYFPRLRNAEIYQEMLAEDNAGKLPILAVSFQGGLYLPRLTVDGLTDARVEYAVLEPNYARHDDSLYWAYYGQLMGDPMGPDATEVDLSFGRWINHRYKADLDLFYTERAPANGPGDFTKEHSGGIAVDVLQIPGSFEVRNFSMLGSMKVRTAFEYVHDVNWIPGSNSLRTMVLISGSLWPTRASWTWRQGQ